MTANKDIEHLDLLSVFHYVVAGLTALFSMFPLIHIAIGIAMVSGAMDDVDGGDGPPAALGWIFIVFPAIIILVGLTTSIFVFLAGRNLNARTNYTFCLVMACILCIFMPFGTVLGVFTIIVLSRPTVKPLFDGSPMGKKLVV